MFLESYFIALEFKTGSSSHSQTVKFITGPNEKLYSFF